VKGLPIALHPGAQMTQKQKKITAVVERALHTTLALAVSPSHLSRYISYLSLCVLSISRDCYVVHVGWDCSGCDFSNKDQQQMQVSLCLLCLAFF
jgi:hypothetical protein